MRSQPNPLLNRDQSNSLSPVMIRIEGTKGLCGWCGWLSKWSESLESNSWNCCVVHGNECMVEVLKVRMPNLIKSLTGYWESSVCGLLPWQHWWTHLDIELCSGNTIKRLVDVWNPGSNSLSGRWVSWRIMMTLSFYCETIMTHLVSC